ncbi:MAG: hypothetical protein H6996_10415 [Moraxellaceae bacterium]|nr:hypothetical protein [Moraxellaceae bacterium]
MKITIEYEASWRNSFLDGSNNEPLPKGGRNFVGSMTTLKQAGNFMQHSITKNTVMGVLNRLIGDQQKLYQARLQPNYYFADIETVLQDTDIVDKPLITNEMAYIRNVSGSTDQNTFTGLIKTNDPWLTSSFSEDFWRVLWLEGEDLLKFILNKNYDISSHKPILEPLAILSKLEDIKKAKLPNTENATTAKLYFSSKYPNFSPKEKNSIYEALPFYCSALYLQLERLSNIFDTSEIRAARGGLTGISHNGFTPKNLMERFTTGKQKLVWGNPYILKEKKKGEGEVTSILSKASGTLEINLDISKEKAKELATLIDNAGVSAFYLGKKGLAYVKDIRI